MNHLEKVWWVCGQSSKTRSTDEVSINGKGIIANVFLQVCCTSFLKCFVFMLYMKCFISGVLHIAFVHKKRICDKKNTLMMLIIDSCLVGWSKELKNENESFFFLCETIKGLIKDISRFIPIAIPVNMASKLSFTISCRLSYIDWLYLRLHCLYRCYYTCMTVCMCMFCSSWFSHSGWWSTSQ